MGRSAAVGFRIHSQEQLLTEVDWRNRLKSVRYERVEIEGSLRRCLHDFMRSVGLFCGSVDIIVDTRGQSWFLEVNQSGQWAWLNDRADGAIARLFAEELEARARSAA